MLTQKDFTKIEDEGDRLQMTIPSDHPNLKEEAVSIGIKITVNNKIYLFGYPRYWENGTLTISAYLVKTE
jgi:hypothetical protein